MFGALVRADTVTQETLNYWKQLTQVMKFFREEEDPNARLPKNFISGFLEVCGCSQRLLPVLTCFTGKKLNPRKTIISVHSFNTDPMAPLLCI